MKAEQRWIRTPFWTASRTCGMSMVTFVLAMKCFGLYTFYRLMFRLFENHLQVLSVLYGSVFAFLWINAIISYVRCVFTHPGEPPASYGFDQTDKVCRRCPGEMAKPPRAHHCSTCQTCICKMDHHCPWVNSCVGWGNQKFFCLFLWYTTIICGYTLTLLLAYFPYELMTTHGDERAALLQETAFTVLDITFFMVLGIICIAFGLSVLMLGCFHASLVCRNTTTIDDDVGVNIFDLGSKRANFEQVFGTQMLLWFFPVATQLGNGLTYPTNRVERV